MKILLIGDGDAKYGASHSLCNLATRLNEKPDTDVTVVLNKTSELADRMEKKGCKVFVVPYQPFYHAVPSSIWKFPAKWVIRGIQYRYGRIFAIRKLEKELDLSSFDIIHSNGSREDFGAQIAEKYHKLLIWHLREFGDLDYKCYSYRHDYIDLMNRTATVMIAVSDAVRDHWIRKGIKPEKIIRVYNGVDERKAPVIPVSSGNRLKGDKNNPIRHVMTGSIQVTKGQIQAVKLIAELKRRGFDAHLDIIGGGDSNYIRGIEKQVERDGTGDCISLLGYKTNVPELLDNYDVGIICSKCEGFGRVTAEYMMAGLPVLASDTGANKELIREGIDGLTYKYGDIEDMADKLIDIVKNKMGGWRHIRMRFMNSQAA